MFFFFSDLNRKREMAGYKRRFNDENMNDPPLKRHKRNNDINLDFNYRINSLKICDNNICEDIDIIYNENVNTKYTSFNQLNFDKILINEYNIIHRLNINNTNIINIKSNKNKECCICQDSLNNKESIKLLKCLHAFHKNCIQSWFKINKICPIWFVIIYYVFYFIIKHHTLYSQ